MVDDSRDQPAPGDAGGTRSERIVVDIDPWSFVALALAGGVALAMFAISSLAKDVLTGIGVGVLLGMAVSPVVSRVQRRWGTSRGLAVVIVGTGLTLAVAAVVVLVAPAAVAQSQEFSDELPSTVRQFYSWPVIGDRLAEADAAGSVERWIEQAPADIDDATLARLGERLLGGVLSALIVVVTALGVLVDGEVVVRRFRTLVPAERRQRADRLGRIVYATFGSYFAGSLLVAVLAGLVTLTTGLILGVPLAPVAGLWTTLTNLIPQIGGFLGASFFGVLAITEGPVPAVVGVAIIVAYQNLENHVISPAIVGRAVNLSPPATMLAVLVGAASAGVPGALVATPLLGAVKAIYLDEKGQMPEPEAKVVSRRISRFLRRRGRRDDRAAAATSAPAAEHAPH
ncbi:MAG TPA: AI-2E family transporter [Acidimicrobiales bacterium]|nr:AI-2E family transporter [Acidimicrobiales bacterium]